MGLDHPPAPLVDTAADRPGRRSRIRRTRASIAVLTVVAVLLLTGCSADSDNEWARLAMPKPGTEESLLIFDLWKWSWVAAMTTGVVVWALIFYAMARFRRRSDDEIPVQTRYNLPLEIFYTFAPVIMVVVFFFHTVQVQNEVLDEVDHPDHTVVVVGQQWQWTFNYTKENTGGLRYNLADNEYSYEEAAGGQNVYEVGAGDYTPTLVLPVGETTEFELRSPDVIHSFWITGFLMKMDIVPGRTNTFQVTPNRVGDYVGKCAELCGAYHARMLFNVKVVTPEEYDEYLQERVERGYVSEAPIMGGELVDTQTGLESESGTESEESAQ